MLHVKSAAAVVAGIALGTACSSSGSKKSTDTDAGNDSSTGETGGSGGMLATGGAPATGGSPATGGTPATGGASGSGGGAVDASLPEAGPPDVVDAGLTCPPVHVDGGLQPDGSVDAGPPDGAAADAAPPSNEVLRWRDWDAIECKLCPSPDLACESVDETVSYLDPTTLQLTIVLRPGLVETVSASVALNYSTMLADGGFDSGTIQTTLDVDRNTLTADLSGEITGELRYFRIGELLIEDACGTQRDLQGDNFSDEFGTSFDDSDSGLPFTIHCEA
jgi:hypothetical protein